MLLSSVERFWKTADCLLLKLQNILLGISFFVGYKTFSLTFCILQYILQVYAL